MPQSGVLKTRVFTSRGQLPVEDAAVSIVQRGRDGKQHLLNIQTSDQSGNTLPTVIETPAPQDSQSPGHRDPFALCDIWAESPGYELLVVENVQIFPGTQTLQELELIPLPEQTDALLPEHPVNIPPQSL